MKLFYWSSNALKEYGSGHLITIANTIDEAKDNIRSQFSKEFSDRFLHLDVNDEDDKDMIEEKFEALERDLKEAPINVLNNTIMINGSS